MLSDQTIRTAAAEDRMAELRSRLEVLLPGIYRERYKIMQPSPMGAAGLQFDACGRVAWDKIWGAFCDLAMAGGPPHKGRLLRSETVVSSREQKRKYALVAAEICRGVTLVTSLSAEPSSESGWVTLSCESETMAQWMVRAITMENVAVQITGSRLLLPADPSFQLEREIKNIVTVCAKTTHYWHHHLGAKKKQAITELFASTTAEEPLLDPALGWKAIECRDVCTAVEAMRLGIAANVLCRREETALMVPAGDELVSLRIQPIVQACFAEQGHVKTEPTQSQATRRNASNMFLSRG